MKVNVKHFFTAGVFLPKLIADPLLLFISLFSISLKHRRRKFEIYRDIALFSYFIIIGINSLFTLERVTLLYIIEFKFIISLLILINMSNQTYRTRIKTKQIVDIMIIINLIFVCFTGFKFRYIEHIPSDNLMSNYMAITVALVYFHTDDKLRKIILFFLLILSASSTGMVAFFGAYMVHVLTSKNLHFVLRIFLIISVTLVGFFLLAYFMSLRGRSFGDLGGIDRVQLMYAGISYILYEFSVSQIIFGYGVGLPIENIYDYFFEGSTVVPWLVNHRATSGVTGLVFHNEYLRVIYNFGMVGLLIAIFYFIKSHSRMKTTSVIILLSSIFTSTLYTTPIIITLFCLKVAKDSDDKNITGNSLH